MSRVDDPVNQTTARQPDRLPSPAVPPGRLRRFFRSVGRLFGDLKGNPTAVAGGVICILFLFAAIFAPVITAHSPEAGNLRARLLPPFWMEGADPQHILGTDDQGRDLWTRIVYATRVSVLVGLVTVAASVVFGAGLGAFAGYFRGKLDSILSRAADLLMAFPYLIFAIAVMAFLGPGFENLILALAFKGWVEFYRLVRGQVLHEKTQEYVDAARALGRPRLAIIGSEILPNVAQTIFVLATLRMGYFIVMEASLSFLGLGIQPPTPAWGSMVAQGRDLLLSAWWVTTFPGVAIVLLVLSLNLLGEGIGDATDPRLRAQ